LLLCLYSDRFVLSIGGTTGGGGAISGIVWNDSDDDGIFQKGQEFGISAITVTLDIEDSGGTVLSTTSTTTDPSGLYNFSLSQSSSGYQFQIYVSIPEGYEASPENVSGSGTNSNIDAEGYSVVFASNGNNVINAGLFPAGNEPGPGNVLVWNPQGGSQYASVVTNWYDKTIGRQLKAGEPGPGPSTPIEFDNNNNDKPQNNAPIIWDESFTVASIKLIQYTGQQTIYGTLESEGANGTALSMDPGSDLGLDLINPNSIFQVDNNATITNMTIKGPHNAENDLEAFIIKGGTTTILPAANNLEQLGVDLTIYAGATLVDKNQTTLNLTGDPVVINVFGEMDTYAGPKNQNTMIGGGGAGGNPDDFISVNGGTLVYYGTANTQDTITVPIEVYNGGTFKLTTAQGMFAGRLIVQGGVPNTNNNSVYLAGLTSSITLDHFDTLEADNGYYQSSGLLETLDFSGGTLQPGAAPGAGTATIAGGWVLINESGGYGQLQVTAATLNFNGALELAIDATNQNNRGQLNLPFGTINLQANSTLRVYVNNGQPAAGLKWIIIDAKNPINPGNFVMLMTTIPNTPALSDKVDPKANTQYTVTS
jgi:hypothetical protein